MKTVLIPGASFPQIDAIEYCKRKGYRVAGCSYTAGDPGEHVLDVFKQVDIKDVEGMTRWAQECDASFIYTVGSDLAMPSVMAASEKLGLPHFLSSAAAQTCHAKHAMRQCLGNGFKGNVPFGVYDNLEEALTYKDFPGMMKPVDSQGQRGCFRVDCSEDIKENFAVSLDYSIEGKVIIEQFIEGEEISVNGYMCGGQLVFAAISDRYAFDEYPGGIIKEHRLPSERATGQTAEEVRDIVESSAQKLGILDGPCYYQIMIGTDSHPYIIEVAPRLDGCHMWKLIKYSCGVDLLDAAYSQLTEGKKLQTETVIASCRPCRLTFMSALTGSTVNRDDYDCSGADDIHWYYESGETVRRLNGYIEKCGYMICPEDEGDR